jgi:hypothetical protein
LRTAAVSGGNYASLPRQSDDASFYRQDSFEQFGVTPATQAEEQ